VRGCQNWPVLNIRVNSIDKETSEQIDTDQRSNGTTDEPVEKQHGAKPRNLHLVFLAQRRWSVNLPITSVLVNRIGNVFAVDR
jgi:hypothetical protein